MISFLWCCLYPVSAPTPHVAHSYPRERALLQHCLTPDPGHTLSLDSGQISSPVSGTSQKRRLQQLRLTDCLLHARLCGCCNYLNRFSPHQAEAGGLAPSDVTQSSYSILRGHRPAAAQPGPDTPAARKGGMVSSSSTPCPPDLTLPWLLGCDHSTPSLPSSLEALLWTLVPRPLHTPRCQRPLPAQTESPRPTHTPSSAGGDGQHPPPPTAQLSAATTPPAGGLFCPHACWDPSRTQAHHLPATQLPGPRADALTR